MAIDCGAGLCDLSALLAPWFAAVHAVDTSHRHLRSGFTASNVYKTVADAAALPYRGGSADLVISMQALHAFDVPRHTAEAQRVLAPGGILAALCYGNLDLKAPLNQAFHDLRQALSDHWEAEKCLTDAGYRTLDFGAGMTEIAVAPAALKRRMSGTEVLAYLARSTAGRAAVAAGVPLLLPPAAGDGWAVWPVHGRVLRKT